MYGRLLRRLAPAAMVAASAATWSLSSGSTLSSSNASTSSRWSSRSWGSVGTAHCKSKRMDAETKKNQMRQQHLSAGHVATLLGRNAKILVPPASLQEDDTTVNAVTPQVHICQFAANNPCEDGWCVRPVLKCGAPGALVGVFDGHSGKAASLYCTHQLFDYLEYYYYSGRTSRLIHPLAFVHADNDFLMDSLVRRDFSRGLSGACFTVCHVTKSHIYTANGGDCRAVVGRRVSHPVTGKPLYQAVHLTRDHQIRASEGGHGGGSAYGGRTERERLLSQHPGESDVIYRDRVKGMLQPTRGFGDGKYKHKAFWSQARIKREVDGWNPPYTTSQPEISRYRRKPNDRFLIMGSDGLFQDLTSEQTVQLVGLVSECAAKRDLTPINAAEFLTSKALVAATESIAGRHDGTGNISIALRLPQQYKRNIHDDITVLVVFFPVDEEEGGAKQKAASSGVANSHLPSDYLAVSESKLQIQADPSRHYAEQTRENLSSVMSYQHQKELKERLAQAPGATTTLSDSLQEAARQGLATMLGVSLEKLAKDQAEQEVLQEYLDAILDPNAPTPPMHMLIRHRRPPQLLQELPWVLWPEPMLRPRVAPVCEFEDEEPDHVVSLSKEAGGRRARL